MILADQQLILTDQQLILAGIAGINWLIEI